MSSQRHEDKSWKHTDSTLVEVKQSIWNASLARGTEILAQR